MIVLDSSRLLLVLAEMMTRLIFLLLPVLKVVDVLNLLHRVVLGRMIVVPSWYAGVNELIPIKARRHIFIVV